MAILYIYPASAKTATLASEQILSIYVGWGDSIKQQNDGARVMKLEPSLRFPVVCPICAKEQLATFSIAILTRGLLSGKSIRLYAACHDKYWDATRIEKEQLREYLSALDRGGLTDEHNGAYIGSAVISGNTTSGDHDQR
jgi:hypothetical protein